MDYSRNPIYQRAMQKMRRLNSSQKAILDSSFLDAAFAKSEMGKTLSGMRLSLNRKADAFTRKTATRNIDLKAKAAHRDRKDVKRATLIGGANVLAGGYFGSQENKRLNKLAAMLKKQTSSYRRS